MHMMEQVMMRMKYSLPNAKPIGDIYNNILLRGIESGGLMCVGSRNSQPGTL